MQTKTYFANSVPAALEVARQELGQDAPLVSSRPAPQAARQFGRLEVTFAFDPQETSQDAAETRPFLQMKAPAKAPASDMDEIRQELSALRAAVGGAGVPLAVREENVVEQRLIEKGFSRDLAADLVSAIGDDADAAIAVQQELGRRIRVVPGDEQKSPEGRTLAFFGPAGRGKTTSLIKIAVRFGLSQRVPVRIYSAGAHGVGAQEQMARYAAILGIPWQSYESMSALNLAMSGEEWRGLLLIDTPGIAPADRSAREELSAFFSSKESIEKHLVLRADSTAADMLHTLSLFSAFKPNRLLFTGVDEAVSPVAMIETLIRSGVAAEFAGTGQQVPEDLREVNAERLARIVWPVTAGRQSFRAAAA